MTMLCFSCVVHQHTECAPAASNYHHWVSGLISIVRFCIMVVNLTAPHKRFLAYSVIDRDDAASMSLSMLLQFTYTILECVNLYVHIRHHRGFLRGASTSLPYWLVLSTSSTLIFKTGDIHCKFFQPTRYIPVGSRMDSAWLVPSWLSP